MPTTLFQTFKFERKAFRNALQKKRNLGIAKEIPFEEAVKLFFLPIYRELYGEDFKFSPTAHQLLFGDNPNPKNTLEEF